MERSEVARVARDCAALIRMQTGLKEDLPDDPLERLEQQAQADHPIPQNQAVLRVLPNASRDDPDVSAEFRHLTQDDLAAAKVAGLEHVVAVLSNKDTVTVERNQAQAVASALTTIRLIVADLLGITSDDDVERMNEELALGMDVGPDHERALDAESRRYWVGIFLATGYAQESLVDGMLGELRAAKR
jgi:hypothetical protein